MWGFWPWILTAGFTGAVVALSYQLYRFKQLHQKGFQYHEDSLTHLSSSVQLVSAEMRLQKKEAEKRLDEMVQKFVSKEEKTYQLTVKVLEDAITQGEGIFVVRRIEGSGYMFRVDPTTAVHRGLKDG